MSAEGRFRKTKPAFPRFEFDTVERTTSNFYAFGNRMRSVRGLRKEFYAIKRPQVVEELSLVRSGRSPLLRAPFARCLDGLYAGGLRWETRDRHHQHLE